MKKKKPQLFVLIITLFFSLQFGIAQTYIGSSIGLNLCNIKHASNFSIDLTDDMGYLFRNYFPNYITPEFYGEKKIYKRHIGLNLGFNINKVFPSKFYFKSGVQFNQYGAFGYSDFYDATATPIAYAYVNINNNYFSVPILIGKKSKGNNYIFAEFGVNNSYLISSYTTMQYTGLNNYQKNSQNIKQYNIALLAGAGFGFALSSNINLDFKASYMHSFSTDLFRFRSINTSIDLSFKI